ncbi:MAG: hypothetical protein IT520_16405 [Burkholderiales bacterium]|nr:hypothetical protein [Burkholderiales bacterium]
MAPHRATRRGIVTIASGLVLAASAFANEPVRHVGIYVTPYYEAAREPGGTPSISVAKTYDARLASNRAEDLRRVRDDIAANNAMLTPMTLMVLAIRLYDVGLRDDSVFWFYAAKNRYATLAEVADVKAPQLAQVEDAVRNFATLAGPVINGYAFCDIAKQQAAAARALAWAIDNPYQALFLPQVPARPGERARNLERALGMLKTAVAREREYLSQPKNVAELQRQRQENGADRRYCWSS